MVFRKVGEHIRSYNDGAIESNNDNSAAVGLLFDEGLVINIAYIIFIDSLMAILSINLIITLKTFEPK